MWTFNFLCTLEIEITQKINNTLATAGQKSSDQSYAQQALARNGSNQTLPLLAKGVACKLKTTRVCTLTRILDHTLCRGSRKTSELPVCEKKSDAFVELHLIYL